jgi:hypothetical protein
MQTDRKTSRKLVLDVVQTAIMHLISYAMALLIKLDYGAVDKVKCKENPQGISVWRFSLILEIDRKTAPLVAMGT